MEPSTALESWDMARCRAPCGTRFVLEISAPWKVMTGSLCQALHSLHLSKTTDTTRAAVTPVITTQLLSLRARLLATTVAASLNPKATVNSSSISRLRASGVLLNPLRAMADRATVVLQLGTADLGTGDPVTVDRRSLSTLLIMEVHPLRITSRVAAAGASTRASTATRSFCAVWKWEGVDNSTIGSRITEWSLWEHGNGWGRKGQGTQSMYG